MFWFKKEHIWKNISFLKNIFSFFSFLKNSRCWVKLKESLWQHVDEMYVKIYKSFTYAVTSTLPTDFHLCLHWNGELDPVFISACATGGRLTQSIAHVILIQVGLCTELFTGVGNLFLWQRCISGWIMACPCLGFILCFYCVSGFFSWHSQTAVELALLLWLFLFSAPQVIVHVLLMLECLAWQTWHRKEWYFSFILAVCPGLGSR